MIKFIPTDIAQLTLDQVDEWQFFVFEGCLYQKVTDTLANRITSPCGSPCASVSLNFDYDAPIEKILSAIKQITWE